MKTELVASKKHHDSYEYSVQSLDGNHSEITVGSRKVSPHDPLRFFIRYGDNLIWLENASPSEGERIAYTFHLDNRENLLYLSDIKVKCRMASPSAQLSVEQFNQAFRALGLGFSYNSIADRVVVVDVELNQLEYEKLNAIIQETFPC